MAAPVVSQSVSPGQARSSRQRLETPLLASIRFPGHSPLPSFRDASSGHTSLRSAHPSNYPVSRRIDRARARMAHPYHDTIKLIWHRGGAIRPSWKSKVEDRR